MKLQLLCMHNFKQSISHCVQYDDGYKTVYSLQWSSFAHNNIVLHSMEMFLWFGMISYQMIKSEIKSKSYHTFLNQIIVLQIKSLYVIQLWFKSNHDLDMPNTAT